MSTELQKQLTAVGSYVFKGVIGGAVALMIMIFNDMRADIKAMSVDMKDISDVVIRLDEKVDRNKSDIDRLDRTKADRK